MLGCSHLCTCQGAYANGFQSECAAFCMPAEVTAFRRPNWLAGLSILRHSRLRTCRHHHHTLVLPGKQSVTQVQATASLGLGSQKAHALAEGPGQPSVLDAAACLAVPAAAVAVLAGVAAPPPVLAAVAAVAADGDGGGGAIVASQQGCQVQSPLPAEGGEQSACTLQQQNGTCMSWNLLWQAQAYSFRNMLLNMLPHENTTVAIINDVAAFSEQLRGMDFRSST